jgi:hypothetical protein
MSKLIIRSPYKNKKDQTNGKPLIKQKVNKLFNLLKKEDLLNDRAEYDEEDLRLAYPELNGKEAKLLFLKIRQWKYAQKKKIKGGEHEKERGTNTKAKVSEEIRPKGS